MKHKANLEEYQIKQEFIKSQLIKTNQKVQLSLMRKFQAVIRANLKQLRSLLHIAMLLEHSTPHTPLRQLLQLRLV